MDFGLLTGIILLFVIFAVTVAVFFYLSGATSSIDIIKGSPPYVAKGLTFYYKPNTGPYSGVGHIFTEACAVAPANFTCGIYYDNPERVSHGECRAAIGSLKNNDESALPDFKAREFLEFEIPPMSSAIFARFPYASFLSIYIGMHRVIPALKEYLKDNGLKMAALMEIYDEENITYIAILGEKRDYMVPAFEHTSTKSAEDAKQELSSDSDTEDSFEKVKEADIADSEAPANVGPCQTTD